MSSIKISSLQPKHFLCVYFKKDNTYTIIKDENGKLKNCKRANVRDEATNKWQTGEIVYRGINQSIDLLIIIK